MSVRPTRLNELRRKSRALQLQRSRVTPEPWNPMLEGEEHSATRAAKEERAAREASAFKAKIAASCPICAEPGSFKPSHEGMPHCKSGSLASGGTKSHCTCDSCF